MIDTIEIDDRISKCEKILASNPQSQIFAALADAHRKKGDLGRAQQICSEGLRLHPEYPSARVVMAKIYLAKGNYDLATRELELAISFSGRTRAIQMLEAEILIRRDQKAEAVLIIQELETFDPNDEGIKNLKALLDERPHPDEVRLPEELSFKLNTEEMKNQSLSHALNILKVMPRVMGALAVGYDGLLLDSRFDSRYSKEEFAALAKGMVDWSIQGCQRIDLGSLNEIMIETPSSKIWIFAREKYYLVIFARDDVSMGALKLKIEALIDNIDI